MMTTLYIQDGRSDQVYGTKTNKQTFLCIISAKALFAVEVQVLLKF